MSDRFSYLHAHQCRTCGLLRTCAQHPCKWRAGDGEAEFECFECRDQEMEALAAKVTRELVNGDAYEARERFWTEGRDVKSIRS